MQYKVTFAKSESADSSIEIPGFMEHVVADNEMEAVDRVKVKNFGTHISIKSVEVDDQFYDSHGMKPNEGTNDKSETKFDNVRLFAILSKISEQLSVVIDNQRRFIDSINRVAEGN